MAQRVLFITVINKLGGFFVLTPWNYWIVGIVSSQWS